MKKLDPGLKSPPPCHKDSTWSPAVSLSCAAVNKSIPLLSKYVFHTYYFAVAMTKIFMKVAQEREGLLFVVAGSLRWDIVSGSRETIAIGMARGRSHYTHSQEAEIRQDMGLGYKTLRATPISSLPHPHTSSLELALHLITLLLLDTWPITLTNTISPTWVLSTYPYFLSSH